MRTDRRVASIVLAAGAGRRFGGRKQLAVLEGRPLLSHALAVATASGAESGLVVLGAFADEIEAGVELGATRVVRCPDWDLGRAASLRAGLGAVPAEIDAALIFLGDEPGVSPVAAERLLAARGPGIAALRATYAGQPGHPVLIERELFGRLTEPAGGLSPGRILTAAGVRGVPCEDLGIPVDIDTREQLDELVAGPPAQRGRPSRVS